MRHLFLVSAVALLGACGTTPEESRQQTLELNSDDVDARDTLTFSADDHTPGFFRDLYRVRSAQTLESDPVAASRWLVEMSARVEDMGALPPLSERTDATLRALLIQSVRGLQALADAPSAARRLGDRMADRMLGLDPAREAWNASHPSALAPITGASAQTVARAALDGVALASTGMPSSCAGSAAAAQWEPGEPELEWVPEDCLPDEWVEGYCEPDYWVDDECYQEWIPDDCDGGYWEDQGRYEWRCFGGDDCRYVWVPRWVYHDGECDGGYYEEVCEEGYWESGLCYDGYFEPGICEPGHYEETYAGGTWSYEAATAPSDCTEVRPSQYAIALTGAQVIDAFFEEELSPGWRAGLTEILDADGIMVPSEARLAALLLVLEAIQD